MQTKQKSNDEEAAMDSNKIIQDVGPFVSVPIKARENDAHEENATEALVVEARKERRTDQIEMDTNEPGILNVSYCPPEPSCL